VLSCHNRMLLMETDMTPANHEFVVLIT